MSFIIELDIEELPEGLFLATSKQVQGLVAQGRTINETIEIAKDVARRILEINNEEIHFQNLSSKFTYPMIMEV